MFRLVLGSILVYIPVQWFHHNGTGYDGIPPDIKWTCLFSLLRWRMWLKSVSGCHCGKEALPNKLRRWCWQKCFVAKFVVSKSVCYFQTCQFVAFVPGGKNLIKAAVNTMASSFIAITFNALWRGVEVSVCSSIISVSDLVFQVTWFLKCKLFNSEASQIW